jgi:nucleosome binding factor SPN SPT16 subunit
MVIIIHFILKNPIPINKKLHSHIQFYKEIGFGAEDLHNHHKNRYEDDEERYEEEAKNSINQLFLKYIKYVE